MHKKTLHTHTHARTHRHTPLVACFCLLVSFELLGVVESLTVASACVCTPISTTVNS